jgi:hypothetical protein
VLIISSCNADNCLQAFTAWKKTIGDVSTACDRAYATTSGWSLAFGDSFVAALQERAALETIDIGCCTDAGGFVVANHHGDGAVEHSPPELALAFFFLRLLQELQQIGTVPAMGYSAYLEGMRV